MKNAYCINIDCDGRDCDGRIIPYIDMRDGKAHCEKCDRAYTIQEFWEILLRS